MSLVFFNPQNNEVRFMATHANTDKQVILTSTSHTVFPLHHCSVCQVSVLSCLPLFNLSVRWHRCHLAFVIKYRPTAISPLGLRESPTVRMCEYEIAWSCVFSPGHAKIKTVSFSLSGKLNRFKPWSRANGQYFLCLIKDRLLFFLFWKQNNLI